MRTLKPAHSPFLPLCAVLTFMTSLPTSAAPPAPNKKITYNLNLLSGSDEYNNELLYALQAQQLPGTHQIEITLNGTPESSEEIEFVDHAGIVSPCLTPKNFKSWGVNLKTTELAFTPEGCWITDSNTEVQANYIYDTLTLQMLIPKGFMFSAFDKNMQNADPGINAIYTNYRFDASHNRRLGTSAGQGSTLSSNYFMSLNSGLNIGDWRLRNTSYLRSANGEWKSQSAYTYAYTNLPALASRLSLGQINTSSTVFEGHRLYGAELSTDTSLLPPQYKSYTPVLSGLAKTNARVTVAQQGQVIYETYVNAGVFELKGVDSVSSSNFVITVHEQDGSSQEFIVLNTRSSRVISAGHWRYGLAAGYLDSNDEPMMQLSLQYGVFNGLSAYAGTQYLQDYHAILFGQAVTLGPWGEAWMETTSSRSVSPRSTHSGQQARVGYNNNLDVLNTSINLTYEQRMSKDYRSLNQHTHSGYYTFESHRLKDRLQAQVFHRLPGRLGTFSVHQSVEHHWTGLGNKTTQHHTSSLSFGSSIGKLSYSMTYTHNLAQSAKRVKSTDESWLVSLSMPLFERTRLSASRLNDSSTLTLSHQSTDRTSNLYLSSTHYDDGSYRSTEAGADYFGRYGDVRAAIGQSTYGDSIRYGATGGMIVSHHGFVLADRVSESAMLVSVKDVENIAFTNSNTARTNGKGYAVINGLSPYNKNTVTVDTDKMPADVDFPSTKITAVPTRGAIIYKNINAISGAQVLFNLSTRDQRKIPYAAVAYIDDVRTQYMVDDGQTLYMDGLKKGDLNFTVRWGEGHDQQCEVKTNIPAREKDVDVQIMNASCI
ncbi:MULTISPECIES: fimbria/pilus outer membrane usher protein [unclassified Pseudomonas]|uniref:fimbria/pilus outer membrane usher protein n=1 Tax=unclassified Pseudomonas TaxID=196821 RepID=UPI000C86DE21|nr:MULTISPECIES: fimbria/pilus outer membrane usher protein [unclassified Pseudomonas]PMV17982.1 hypothetical protein C1X17_28040 [Pseudomonas sp. FW305-3-2-15-C-TSA2]PMV18612.1 hypothetical protein C1X22_29465 [Pseudomonas sp. DP16D-L5]PMV33415.1 hypothetical protein C1X21_28965 [Pseudomonas sp. FW305-3-2-15-A-LB2]PMV37990.1 hypothetical protein C1X16_29640 [Pseudomonas sp. FW305-3-2-15-C-R2A1]PMV43565.1 hypothetical protein C1X18_28260 [Pseudomonas sp. FW305-3-2-15-C-LB1]